MSPSLTCGQHGAYERPAHWPPARAVTCPECADSWKRLVDQTQTAHDIACVAWDRWERSGIPTRYQNRTLANWHPAPGQESAGTMIRSWVEALDDRWDDGDGLLLMGAPGVGKTHLLAGLVTTIVQHGYSARYACWPAVWDTCKPPFDRDGDGLLRELAEVSFLALDELGLRPGSDKEQARLFELIDARYRESLPTIVATNATEATLTLIGERTADRLMEACIPIVIPGTSNRSQAAVNAQLRGAPRPIDAPKPASVSMTLTVDGLPVERTYRATWRQ